MAKVGVYLPGSISTTDMQAAMHGYLHIEPQFIVQLHTQDIAQHALSAVSVGCDLFIARGLQAEIISRTVGESVPVLPLRLSAQEAGILIQRIKKEIVLDHPLHIRFIGYANMYPDMSHFSELFGADIQVILIRENDDLSEILTQARNEGVNAVVGGRHCCEAARKLSIPSYFAEGGNEILTQTLDLAEKMCELIDTSRQDSAENEAIIENNFNGILHIGSHGEVLKANRVMLSILQKDAGSVLTKPWNTVLPAFDESLVNDAIHEGRETFSFMYRFNRTVYAVNISPIKVGETIEGAYLTFQEGRVIRQLSSDIRHEMVKRGYVAFTRFEDFPHFTASASTSAIRMAGKAAGYSIPVLLLGAPGSNCTAMAEAIHNASMVAGNAFVNVSCRSYSTEQMDRLLFGDGREPAEMTLLEAAQEGTLYLQDVDALTIHSQSRLLSLLRDGSIHLSNGRTESADVRIIASSTRDLLALSTMGEFLPELYYALGVYSIHLEPLNRRREDILPIVDFYMAQWQKTYSRFTTLTMGARQALSEYDWPGNELQVSQVTQRITLLCDHHEASELFVRQQLEQSFAVDTHDDVHRIVTFQDRKAYEITQLLEKYQGSRERVARELGVSKTTLWRYMKKYGIGGSNS